MLFLVSPVCIGIWYVPSTRNCCIITRASPGLKKPGYRDRDRELYPRTETDPETQKTRENRDRSRDRDREFKKFFLVK